MSWSPTCFYTDRNGRRLINCNGAGRSERPSFKHQKMWRHKRIPVFRNDWSVRMLPAMARAKYRDQS